MSRRFNGDANVLYRGVSPFTPSTKRLLDYSIVGGMYGANKEDLVHEIMIKKNSTDVSVKIRLLIHHPHSASLWVLSDPTAKRFS